jgi:hypothetical protein
MQRNLTLPVDGVLAVVPKIESRTLTTELPYPYSLSIKVEIELLCESITSLVV